MSFLFSCSSEKKRSPKVSRPDTSRTMNSVRFSRLSMANSFVQIIEIQIFKRNCFLENDCRSICETLRAILILYFSFYPSYIFCTLSDCFVNSNESNSILSRFFEIKYSTCCEQEMFEATSELTKTNSFQK